MKKIILSTVLMASLVACYKEDAILNDAPQDPLTKAKDYLSGDERVKMKRHKITADRAVKIAEEARGLFADENERIIKTRSIGAILAPVAITNQTKTRAAGGVDTLMYVVNYGSNGGYVFVSNDDRDGEILMYAGNGNFAMQDTAGNIGLKMHVEMMLAYQEHKLSEIRVAEARGEYYMGGMTTDEVALDECLPNILNNTRGAVGTPGMPGVPGHTCNITGQSGMPGLPGSTPTRKDICAPATYVDKYWEGDDDAIELAQKKYKNQKCFGVPVMPPSVKFTTMGVPGVDDSHQNCFPYCSPHISDYEGYYKYYGAKMNMLLKTVTSNVANQYIAPLLTTCWDQGVPLKHNTNSAGCGPIAVAQIMLYHGMPKKFTSKAFGGVYDTGIDVLRTLRNNADLENTAYMYHGWRLLEEIRARLNVTYNSDGSTSSLINDIIPVIRSFGYSIGYGGGLSDYYVHQTFSYVAESIQQNSPVIILGRTANSGHAWVLDGYKRVLNRTYYADYYFDEYGKFNKEDRYTYDMYTEYVHANMGWGSYYLTWVAKGVYEFYGTNYDHKLVVAAGIKPI